MTNSNTRRLSCCCYSCCIWRCFLDERSENRGAQQLFTRGILCHSFPLMWAFSLLLPFLLSLLFLFFFPSFFFSSPCVFVPLHHLSVLCLLNQFAHSWRPLPRLHPWHFPFSLQNCRNDMQVWVNPPRVLGCLSNNTRTTAWFVLCTNLNSLYPLGIVKAKAAEAETDMEKISHQSTGY